MNALLTLPGVAGVTYVMGVRGADDVMLVSQSTSFHDALTIRAALGKGPAPEFEAWLDRVGIGRTAAIPPGLSPALIGLGRAADPAPAEAVHDGADRARPHRERGADGSPSRRRRSPRPRPGTRCTSRSISKR